MTQRLTCLSAATLLLLACGGCGAVSMLNDDAGKADAGMSATDAGKVAIDAGGSANDAGASDAGAVDAAMRWAPRAMRSSTRSA